jgi:GT2 family glycosyltransferase
MAPKCYVIVLNYNGKSLGLLDDCFGSLLHTNYPNTHYLFVDNGSGDESIAYMQERYPVVDILDNQVNLGFAEGNNHGIRYALQRGADYIILLNNDTRVEADWISNLVEVAEEDPTIGLCESQQYTWDNQRAIRLRLRLDWLEGEMILEPIPATRGGPHSTAYASGCCLLIRRSMIERIGVFDPRYFAYVEDVDLSLRAWISGYSVVKVPSSIVYHKIGSTSTSLVGMKLGYRNQLLTMFKNYEISTLKRFSSSILKRWIFTRNRYALGGMLAFLLSMQQTIARRKQIQNLRQRSDQEIFTLCGY